MVEAKKGAGALQDLNGKIELAEDTITLNEEFKKNVAIPYFKDIYKDLVSQSDSKSKGINKISLLTVSTHTHTPYLSLSTTSCASSASPKGLASKETAPSAPKSNKIDFMHQNETTQCKHFQ